LSPNREESSPGFEAGKREAARRRARKMSRGKKERKRTAATRTKKGADEEEGEEDGLRRANVEENEEKLPADSSSVSVEANDAKTGVHCPQLRARGGGEQRGKEGEKDYLAGRETKRVYSCR